MKTIQMTIDEGLLNEVDQAIEALHTSRSAFIRDALAQALRRYKISELEQCQAAGYTAHPVEPGEFDVWQDEQMWGEA
jgi:metal-responsive CopG/Arc/MetJ family transcriptional regulator